MRPWRSSFVSKYVLGDRIGEGGMGVVHRAEQPALARTVAIKLLRSELAADRSMSARFRAEALAMARLSHPNLITVIDYGETEEGTPFLVMEYVHGRSLGELVRAGAEMPIERAIALTLQVLSGLAAAHAAGVIHADVKSDNVLVGTDHDGRERIKLVDFGLARRPDADRDGDRRDGQVLGTPEYMAPEVIRGAQPARPADLYGVGVILYELLTGAPPFTGTTPAEVMSRHLEDALVPMAVRRPDRRILPILDRIVAHALAKSPTHRVSDALAFAAELELASATFADAETSPPGWIADPALRSPPLVPRVARGSGLESEPLPCHERSLRRDICDAISRGKSDAIARGYVELAAMLAIRGQIHAAIHELEEALDLMTEGLGPSAATGKAKALVDALLPLYAQINDQREAYAEAADRWGTLTE